MDISKISTSVLKNILKLTEKREALLSELGKIEEAITALYEGSTSAAPVKTAPAKRGRKPKAVAAPAPEAAPRGRKPKKVAGSRRGALKENILAALAEAGSEGISVKDLSEKLGVKNQNVHVWFSSTGRKLGTIEKVGSGRYRLTA